MLDLKFVRKPQLVEEAIAIKGETDLEEFCAWMKRRSCAKVEALKNKRNTVSRQIGAEKKGPGCPGIAGADERSGRGNSLNGRGSEGARG